MNPVFSRKLLLWHRSHGRSLPWAGQQDPYRVWLSEIILQQTRVEQGTGYYNRILKAYPTIHTLARAPEQDILKLWEGLGYYSRARNLHATAKFIAHNLEGKFPDTYEELIKLKGVGAYTASAIMAYAYRKPFAVVDNNVLRVISRLYGITEPVDQPSGRETITALANKLLNREQPHIYNQALMDFSALVCLPRRPDCPSCPFRSSCVAHERGLTGELPLRSPKAKREKRYLHFFVLYGKGKVLINQRTERDIWKNLWQFPLLETGAPISLQEIMRGKNRKVPGFSGGGWELAAEIYQTLTHRKLNCRFYVKKIQAWKDVDIQHGQVISINKLNEYAFPGAVRSFLKTNPYF